MELKQWIYIVPIVLCAMLLLVGLNAHRLGSAIMGLPDNEPASLNSKEYTRSVAQGLAVQSGSFPGVDLVRFESCRIEKQTKGGFSCGGFNVLVMDGLEICLPPDAEEPVTNSKYLENGRKTEASMQNILEPEFRRLLAPYPRFSKVKINGLSISHIVAAANGKYNRVNILSAKTATTGRDRRLNLSECGFWASTGERIECKRASVVLEKPFLINTDHGAFQLAGSAAGFNEVLAGTGKQEMGRGR
jgi:hypothetical protein